MTRANRSGKPIGGWANRYGKSMYQLEKERYEREHMAVCIPDVAEPEEAVTDEVS